MAIDRYVNAVLKQNQTIIDSQLKSLESVANKLQRKIMPLLQEGAKSNELIDLIKARKQIIDMLDESGYYDVINKGLSEDYQKIIQANLARYEKYLSKSLQFQEVSAQRLDMIRQATFDEFKLLGDKQVNGLQKILMDLNFGATDMKQAVSTMESLLDEKFVGDAERLVNTAVQGFSRSVNNQIATDNGFKYFEYYGPNDTITREFCKDLLNNPKKAWTEEEINAMDNGTDLPVFQYCGSYNCRHQWVVYTGDVK